MKLVTVRNLLIFRGNIYETAATALVVTELAALNWISL
jgi:hypothetical protein